MTDKINSPGREANEALPAGERPGLVSDADTRKTGQKERRTAGPDGGGKEPGGSGRGKHTGHPAAHMGGEKGGKAAASRTAAERSASAKKAAATRKRNAEHTHH